MDELLEELAATGIEYALVELPLGGKALYIEMDNPKNSELLRKAGWDYVSIKEWLWDRLEDANIYQLKVKLNSKGDIIEYFRGIP